MTLPTTSIPHFQYEGEEHFDRLLDSVEAGRNLNYDITFILTKVDENSAAATSKSTLSTLIRDYDIQSQEAQVTVAGAFHGHFVGNWMNLFSKKVIEAGLYDMMHVTVSARVSIPSQRRRIRSDCAYGPCVMGLPLRFVVEAGASQGIDGNTGLRQKAFDWLVLSNAPVQLVLTVDLTDDNVTMALWTKEAEGITWLCESSIFRWQGGAKASSPLTIPLSRVLDVPSPDVVISERELERLAATAWMGAVELKV